MKILQLNIWCGRLGKQIIEVLNREKADVVCLQEATDIPGDYAVFFDSLNKIKSETKYTYSFFTPHFGFKIMKRNAKSGPVILSNLPFVDTNAIFTRLQYIEDFDLLDIDYNVRALQHVVVESNGKKINILNHHGHHIPDHKNGDEETMRQCKEIIEYIEKLDDPTVLCGDFNLIPESESLEQINKVLVNHVKERKILTTRTVLTHKKESCDYVFTSPELEVTNFQVLDDVASDHKALTIEFK